MDESSQIRCALQEWQTGTFSNVNFDQNIYSTVYQTHITDLEKFELKGSSVNLLEKICTKLSERGRYVCVTCVRSTWNDCPHSSHAKAPIERYTSQGGIPDDQMDRAIAAYTS